MNDKPLTPCRDCRGVCRGAQRCPNLIDEDFKKSPPVKNDPIPIHGDMDDYYRKWDPYTRQYYERSW